MNPKHLPLIELDHATVIRDGVAVLDGMSLSIGRGEHTAIIGPNGSGKSTLIRLLTGDVYPVARPGSDQPLRIFGRRRWNLSDLRALIGIVSTDVHQRFVGGSSMGHVTGLEAVVAGFFSSEVLFFHHDVTDEMWDRARAALSRVDSSNLAERPMHRMSTGEARRILIARGLVHEPSLLLLDEPTSGLDLVARHDFLARLRNLAREGTTLILVTHHVEEIIPEIGRIILLDDGRVAADGAPDEVLTSERLSRVFGSPLALRRRGDGYELQLSLGAAG
jgi:iron complex transport system ATP-binding protein